MLHQECGDCVDRLDVNKYVDPGSHTMYSEHPFCRETCIHHWASSRCVGGIRGARSWSVLLLLKQIPKAYSSLAQEGFRVIHLEI
jgi:hypothetical protein